MRNTIVLDRIQGQMARNTPASIQVAYNAIQAASVSPPISFEELRDMLMQELDVQPAVVVQSEQCDALEEIRFNNLYDWTAWYESHRSEFTEPQKTALDTLAQTRAAIEIGCACRRNSREHAAHAYFGSFWTNNATTDILPTIAKISKAQKVFVGSFCSYPA